MLRSRGARAANRRKSAGGNPAHNLDFDFDDAEDQADTGWFGWESASAHQHAWITSRLRLGSGHSERFETHNNTTTDMGGMGTIRSLMGVYNTNDGGNSGSGTPAGPGDSYWCWSSYFPTSGAGDASATVVGGFSQTQAPGYQHLIEIHERSNVNGSTNGINNLNEVANHAIMVRSSQLQYRGRCGSWTWNGSSWNSPSWNTTTPGTNGANDQIPVPIVKSGSTNATLPMDTWVDIILHIRFRTDSTGLVEVWARQSGQSFSGSPNLSITGPTHKSVTGSDSVTRTSAAWEQTGITGCYMEVGLYNGSSSWSDGSNGAHVHIVDELRRWTTEAEAKANWG